MTLRLLLISLLGLTLPRHGQAQTTAWCPLGAEWKFGYGEQSVSGTLTMRYTGDTLVGGRAAQVLRRSTTTAGIPPIPYTSPLPNIITRLAGDSVLFWYGGRYVPLYCFGVRPGQSWTTYAAYPTGVCGQYPVQVTVDSVGTQLLGGRLVRWQAVHVSGNHAFWGPRIYEGIGNVRSLQAGASMCGGTDPGSIGPLLSFRATGLPAVGSGGGSGLTLLAAAEARAQQAGFAAYPTPTTGQLTVQVPAALRATGCLALHDLTGRLVWQQSVPASAQLDLGNLPKGVYLLTLEGPEQAARLSRRVVLR